MKLFKRRAPRDVASLGNVQLLSRWRRLGILGAVYVLVVALCAWLDPAGGVRGTSGLFESAEFSLYGRRLDVYARRHDDVLRWVQKQIVLVPLSDETFDKDWGGVPGPPAPRDYQAKVVSELTRAGVKGIVFDMVFESESTPAHDNAFEAALRRSGRTFLGCWFTEDDSVLQRPIAKFGAVAPLAHLLTQQSEHQVAIDRIKPVVRLRGSKKFVPSLSMAGAMLGAGLHREEIRRAPGGWQIGRHFVPVDGNGEFNIIFWGKPANSRGEGDSMGGSMGQSENGLVTTGGDSAGVFPSVPFEQIYEGAVDDPFYKDNGFFKDKVVLIGDITKLGNDFRLTARGQMAGMEIQAHAMATLMALLQKDLPLPHEAPRALNIFMIALLAALACRFASTWRLPNVALGMVFTLLGFALFNVWLFTEKAIFLHVVAPSAALLLTTSGVLGVRIFSEERQKSWMRSLLQRCLSPQVADYLVSHPEKMNLGGELVTATVLFSDVRGFTALSRRYDAQFIVGLLNEYLQAMTDVIFKHNGTLDKYMGDGIMVLFGLPLPADDHARRAVAVAIDMQEAMLALNESWRARDLPLLDIGVGIATGPMIGGNMGAVQRMEFTAIGDTVNLASRIEGLNKDLATKLLIHESTYAAVQTEIEARGPLSAPVKGHDEDVVVYEVLGWKRQVQS